MSIEPTPLIKVLLADPHALFCQALKGPIDAQSDMRVVAAVADGLSAVAEAERRRPHVVVVDNGLPECDGVQATYLIKDRVPECKVMMLWSNEDFETLLQVMEAGASAVLSKEQPLGDFLDAIRRVHHGDTVVPPHLLGPLIDRLLLRKRDWDDGLRRVTRLTRREREVLVLLAQGRGNDTIAEALSISRQTARTHIQNLLTKLDVHSRLEAAALVNQTGMLDELMRVDA